MMTEVSGLDLKLPPEQSTALCLVCNQQRFTNISRNMNRVQSHSTYVTSGQDILHLPIGYCPYAYYHSENVIIHPSDDSRNCSSFIRWFKCNDIHCMEQKEDR